MKKEKAKANKAKINVELNIECAIEADTLLEAVQVLKEKYNIDVEAEDVAARIECVTDNDVADIEADTKLSSGDSLRISIAPMKSTQFTQREEPECTDEPETEDAEQKEKAEDIAQRIEEILGQIQDLEEKWGGRKVRRGNQGCRSCNNHCESPFGPGFTTIRACSGPDIMDVLRQLRESGNLF